MAKITEYEKLEKEFNKKVVDLQKRCPHKKTEIVQYSSILFHGGEFWETCVNCRKKIKKS